MKKAKIMLMTIAVLATVGSALAFKVNQKGLTTYCYLQTSINPGSDKGVCPNKIVDATAEVSTSTQYFYTTLTADKCSNQTDCTNPAFDFAE